MAIITGNRENTNIYIKYLKYLLKHKWLVMIACFKRGLIIQGILHDISKFQPIEFISYAQFFCGKGQPKNKGFAIEPGEDSVKRINMEKGWLHHVHKNRHHWNYWIVVERGGNLRMFDMPRKYIIEMVYDWESASKVLRGKNASAKEWYDSEKDKLVLTQNTRRKVEGLLGFK